MTITHRLSTIRNADRIVLIRNGVVIEQGTHQQLMNIENGVYATMIEGQQKDLDKERADDEQTEERHDSARSTNSKSSHLRGNEPTQKTIDKVKLKIFKQFLLICYC